MKKLSNEFSPSPGTELLNLLAASPEWDTIRRALLAKSGRI